MKKMVVLSWAGIIITCSSLQAQDSTKRSAAQQIIRTSEKTDALQGKKIQQQNLLNNKVERLDSSARPVLRTKKKKSC